MLIEFEAQGVFSFAEKVTVSFAAKPKTRLKNTKYEDNFFFNSKHKAMKTAVFFGSNATGKTNLFSAIKFLRVILMSGLENAIKQGEGEHLFFNGSDKGSDEIFLSIMVSNDQEDLFRYEICFDSNQVIKSEKLSKNQRDVFFYKDSSLNSSILSKNEKFEQIKKAVELSASIKTTIIGLLNYLVENNEIHEFLKCIQSIKMHSKDSYSKKTDLTGNVMAKLFCQDHKEEMLQLFRTIDPSIDDFSLQPFDQDGEEKYRYVILRNDIEFNLKGESEGVKKIVKLSIPLIKAIRDGATIMIDELDSSITTLTLIELFNSFINTPTNQKAQLIITSHNLLLFDVSFLNSQQIFIVQKDHAKLYTYIKSYYEYDIRSEKKQAYVDYLKGAYDGK